jgi:hypothetical protein
VKKLEKKEGEWSLTKDILGFHFSGHPGEDKTMQLEAPKREFLLATLHKWVRAAAASRTGILFPEFESVLQKIRHVFWSIPSG